MEFRFLAMKSPQVTCSKTALQFD